MHTRSARRGSMSSWPVLTSFTQSATSSHEKQTMRMPTRRVPPVAESLPWDERSRCRGTAAHFEKKSARDVDSLAARSSLS